MNNDTKFNILRGITVASHLENDDKAELLEFITEMEGFENE
ncbi:hypothetical protein [Alkalibaculum sporogenes]|nr:hypothetical protein [Alkalibaculum sporogenes]